MDRISWRFFEATKVADFADLNSKLDYKQFKFTEDERELPEFVKKIKTAKKLYAYVNRLDHPLEILNNEVFKENNSRALQLKLEELSKETDTKLKDVKAEMQQQLSNYQKWLDKHFGDYYETVKKQISSYKKFIVSNQDEYGELFFKMTALQNFVFKL